MYEYINNLLAKTLEIHERYNQLGALIASPEIIADNKLFRRLVRERATIEEVSLLRAELVGRIADINTMQAAIGHTNDTEYTKLIIGETKKLETEAEALAEKLREALQQEASQSCMLLELKASDAGISAAFCARLIDIYLASAAANGWQVQQQSLSGSPGKAVKSASYIISGYGVYQALSGETGVHQAIGLYEQDKSKTAAVTVVAIKFVEYPRTTIAPKDLRIDIFHSGGAGGQNVNKVATAVRITHLPTGIVVVCQDERSQLKNRNKALENLEKRLDEHFKKQIDAERKRQRKIKFAEAAQNDKMRTYDYISGKITDHLKGTSITIDEARRGGLLQLTQ